MKTLCGILVLVAMIVGLLGIGETTEPNMYLLVTALVIGVGAVYCADKCKTTKKEN